MPIEVTPIEGYRYLGTRPEGIAVVASSPRMRVMDVASAYTCDYSDEEIKADFPFLSLSEIHQAIAYYLDHREEIDEALRKSARPSKHPVSG